MGGFSTHHAKRKSTSRMKLPKRGYMAGYASSPINREYGIQPSYDGDTQWIYPNIGIAMVKSTRPLPQGLDTPDRQKLILDPPRSEKEGRDVHAQSLHEYQFPNYFASACKSLLTSTIIHKPRRGGGFSFPKNQPDCISLSLSSPGSSSILG